MSVWSGGTVQNTYIYNNTVNWNPANLTGGHYAIFVTSMAGGRAINNTNFYNNIIYSASPNLVSIENYATEQHLDYNMYWYTGAGNPTFRQGTPYYYSLADWQAATGKDLHSFYTNPLMNDPTYHDIGFPTNSFTLQSNSPAINAGANLVALGLVSSMGTRDFYGNAIPNGAYDIGAVEYGGGGGPTATPPPPTATPTPGVMHVSNIAMAKQKQGASWLAKATVTIVDANNAPVGTATVSGQFTGATNDNVSGNTDASGNVTLNSSKKSGGGAWTFCVTNVVKSGWTYNSSANVETCDTITAP